jgi:hypothetical protein
MISVARLQEWASTPGDARERSYAGTAYVGRIGLEDPEP